MSESLIQVNKKDVKPLLNGLEEKLPGIDLEGAEYFLFRIPPQQKLDEAHVKRLEALRKLRFKEIRRFINMLDERSALPVVKIKADKMSYVVKPTHGQVSDKLFDSSQKNIRFEAQVSGLASDLNIGPRIYARYYFNPGMLLMVEECISKDNGWSPMYAYAGKLDSSAFPRALGKMIGELHKSRYWKAYDNQDLQGRLWYKDRVLLHSFYNTKTGYLRLVDFGNAELISPVRFKEDNIPRSRLIWEVENAATGLLSYVFPHDRAIRQRNSDKFSDVLSKFCESYSNESGIHVKPGDLMGRIISKS